MEAKNAKILAEETFNSKFSKEQFRRFIRNLLDGIDEKKSFSEITLEGEMFRDKITSYERIGQYTDNKHNVIDVLSVRVADRVSLDRSRTMLRNFTAWYMEKMDNKDNVLVAFWREDCLDWRFSLVNAEWKLVENSAGKQKSVKELSSARRHSFIVGENEKNHTVQSRMFQLLVKEKPSLSDIKDAFDVEKVSREFFECYKELFLDLVDELREIRRKSKTVEKEFTKKCISEADFCKKLLAQLVFLYFIQKKGWLGVDIKGNWGEGDRQFLRTAFKRAIAEKKNFFNDYLEPLFYDALANGKRKGDVFELLDCRIPFLNGGLFDPVGNYDWKSRNITFDNSFFSNEERTKDGTKGTGILDVFDRYNFTVKEDEPLEKEVAVDPEMLGKVFENLLEIKDRKDKGAFYTPREIVHYMCQESLICYLDEKIKGIKKDDISLFIRNSDTLSEWDGIADEKEDKGSLHQRILESIKPNAKLIDEALASIKICDPAIGSGAFPVGMLTEIVKARIALVDFGFLKRKGDDILYQYKRDTIQNSIYGVDIESGAVEIARLRLWLSLVVDEDNVQEIKPLPNLDCKIVCGNSLFKVEKYDLFNDADIEELIGVNDKLFYETDKDKKEILKKRKKYLENELARGEDLDIEIKFLEVFVKHGGFDITIGNPPYVQLQKLKGNPLQKKYQSLGFKVYDSTGDVYCLFYEKGTKILKQGGHLCYITSNKWMRAGYGEKLRSYFVQETQPLRLIDFAGTKIFDEATVDTNILLLKKEKGDTGTFACIASDKECLNNLSDFVNQNSIRKEFNSGSWCILNPIEQSIKEKIENIGIPLKKWDIKIYRGVLTGFNKAFIIDGAKREELIKDLDKEKADEIIRPILRGRDIKRYGCDWKDLWLIYVPWHFPLTKDKTIQGASKAAEKEFQKQYPAIYNHLLKYKKELSARNQEETGKRYEWYALQRYGADYMDDFSKQKIMYPNMTKYLPFYYDDKGFLQNDKSFFITGKNIAYLTAFLNSSLFKFCFKDNFPQLGEKGRELRKIFFEKIPVKKVSEKENEVFKAAVEDIQKEYSEEKAIKIDKMIFNLYNLNEEERETIGFIDII